MSEINMAALNSFADEQLEINKNLADTCDHLLDSQMQIATLLSKRIDIQNDVNKGVKSCIKEMLADADKIEEELSTLRYWLLGASFVAVASFIAIVILLTEVLG